MEELPEELTEKILENLELRELLGMSQTSKTMKRISNRFLREKEKRYLIDVILDYILKHFHRFDFERGLESHEEFDDIHFLGFTSYEDFKNRQFEILNDMNLEKLRLLNTVINDLIPISDIMDEEFMIDKNISGLILSNDGRIIFTSGR